MKRRLPHLLWVAGSVLMLLAFVLFAGHGIPYQDATSEQMAEQKAGLRKFNLTFFTGVIGLITGLIWLMVRAVRLRKNRVS